jgi:hypothetical protein
MNSGKFMLMIILNYLHNTNSLVATNGLMVTNHLVVAICLVSTNRLVARRGKMSHQVSIYEEFGISFHN